MLHDIRFVEDDWESPTLGRLGPGLGSVVRRDGDHPVHLFPAGRRHRLRSGLGRITYGLERLAMYVQDVEFVYDLAFNDQFRYGEVFHQTEQEFSAYNFERADTEILFQHFEDAEKQCRELLTGKQAAAARL